MKKIVFRVMSLALCLALAAGMIGCGKKNVNTNEVNGVLSDYLVAEKVGSVNRGTFNTASGGLYYKDDNGLYGVMSLEGLRDTGAVYEYCMDRKEYFIVSTKLANDYYDIEGLNSFELIDGKGKTVIPAAYADFYFCGGNYVQVFKAAERTFTDNDAAVIKFNKSEKITAAEPEEALYRGTWYVYDLTTGMAVPGATGTKNANIMLGYGDCLVYTDDAGTRHSVDKNGVELPEGADLFEDGSYSIEGKVGEVYDGNHNKLFSYDLTGFIPNRMEDDRYTAAKYADGTSKYVVMDKTGSIVSAEFEGSISLYGDVVFCDHQVYNLEGKQLIDGKYNNVYFDKMFRNNWVLQDDGGYTMINKDGSVIFTGDNKKTTVFSSDFVASQKIDDAHYYYSHKDQDFTIKGYGFAPWIVKTDNSNGLFNVVDTMTGNILLEGYSSYSYTARNSSAYYVYAKYNGGADVYLIVANSQLADVNKKRGSLLDELIAAFAQEGINVTVDKENGTMSLDSGVLFGGDSAALSAEGKAFLNKFIKVYTSVAFSDKYAGFISKTMVEGHTAPLAGSTYASGLQLSEERATNVKDYCLSPETGVDVSGIANTLEAIGYSNSQPVYDASGNVNLEASRRVTFRFLVAIDM